jgi:hypothetical protein
VHVREDGRNEAGVPGRFGSPGGRVKVSIDNNLVYAIIGGKDPDRGVAELGVNLFFRLGQDSCSSPYNMSEFFSHGRRRAEARRQGRSHAPQINGRGRSGRPDASG